MMKNQLIVLYEENKKNPENTWSGTSFQLREALKEYFEVIFVDSYDICILKLLKIVCKKIEKKHASLLIRPLYEKLHEIEINARLVKYQKIPVLEISENVVTNNDFYLYRDMSYACYQYVWDKFKNDNNDYGNGMLKSVCEAALKQRIKREQLLEKKAKGVFFMGQWIIDILGNNDNKYIYAGGGLNRDLKFESIRNKEPKTILFVGIDFKRKGGDLLVRTFKLLKEKYNIDAKLIIAGPDKIGIEENIEYVGKVDRKKLSELFMQASVFCMPSRFEAYGLVLIEALCYGLPIVAYNDFEMKHFVQNEKNGYLLNDFNEDELADKLFKALTNQEMKKYVEEHKNEYINNYSWSRVAQRIYQRIEGTNNG